MSGPKLQDIGPILRQFRRNSGVSLGIAATRAKMEKSQICRYERGGASITSDILDVLSQAIGCRPEAVLLVWFQTRYPKLRRGKAGQLLKALIREVET